MRASASSVVRTLLVLVALVLVPLTARAEPGDEYTISVLTMSPGDPLFFKFGHNAILVHDARTRTDSVYNWGTFSFQEPGLVSKFLKGRLSYWLSVQGLNGTIVHYRSENRWLYQQTLNLSAAQKRKLVAMVTENARDENKYYRYHYYRDNCSTRVRDLIDTATAGSLKAVSTGRSPLTFRGETSRLTGDVGWGYVFLNLAMGDYIDKPITQWDQMFVPQRVMETLRRATTVDEQGNVVPLVRSEKWLVQANRAPVADAPPRKGVSLFAIGALVGAAMGALAYWQLKRRGEGKTPIGRRLAFALPVGLLTFLTGFLGSLFLFFWLGTDHEVAWHNENLLQTSPLSLAMVVVAIGVLRDRAWARRALPYVAYGLVAMSVLGLALKVLPWFDQVNGPMIAMFLPLWAGLAAGCFLAVRPRKGAGSAAAAGEATG